MNVDGRPVEHRTSCGTLDFGRTRENRAPFRTDPAAQRELYRLVECEAIRRGKGAVIDGWGDDLRVLRG